KLDRPDRRKLTVFLPIPQRCQNFIEDQHAWYKRRIRKMSRQAGMIGRNRAACFEGHLSEVFLMPAAPATRPALIELLTLPPQQLFCSLARRMFPARSQTEAVAIDRKSSSALRFFHAKLREIVPVKPVSFLRLACQRLAHPLLYFLGQRPTKVHINTSHHRERIATNLNIID